MTNEEIKVALINYINEYDLSFVLVALAEVADIAAANNPGFAFSKDARLIRSILPKIEN